MQTFFGTAATADYDVYIGMLTFRVREPYLEPWGAAVPRKECFSYMYYCELALKEDIGPGIKQVPPPHCAVVWSTGCSWIGLGHRASFRLP